MGKTIRIAGALLTVALVGAACSTTDPVSAGGAPTPTAGAASAVADTRAALVQALGEHVFLASIATGAALGGRTEEFEAAAGALDDNSRAISDALAGPLGKTSDQVYELWNSHIQMVVKYTQATAAGDAKGQRKQVSNLLAYATQFGAIINGALPSLPAQAVTDLVTHHITTLKSVIDAQANGNFRSAARLLRAAYAHMDMIAGPLATAIAG